jgi:hypothetical protein
VKKTTPELVIKKKVYTIKPPSKKVLKPFWEELEVAENEFYEWVGRIENSMAVKTGITDIEFFSCDGEYVGIGNASRTLKLIHRR